jgi:hypothetical protein
MVPRGFVPPREEVPGDLPPDTLPPDAELPPDDHYGPDDLR